MPFRERQAGLPRPGRHAWGSFAHVGFGLGEVDDPHLILAPDVLALEPADLLDAGAGVSADPGCPSPGGGGSCKLRVAAGLTGSLGFLACASFQRSKTTSTVLAAERCEAGLGEGVACRGGGVKVGSSAATGSRSLSFSRRLAVSMNS